MKIQQEKQTGDCSVEAACTQLFAMVTASVSHEVKNVLAIINENGGLLEDLVLMTGPDQGIPSEHVQKATQAISRQVERANRIMKTCNRLAHLGDKQVSRAPLAEILELVVSLGRRQADMKNVNITVHCDEELHFTTSMLPFVALVYLLLRAMIDAASGETSFQLSASSDQKTLTLSFMSDTFSKEWGAVTRRSDIQGLLQQLEATTDGGECVLRFNIAPEAASFE